MLISPNKCLLSQACLQDDEFLVCQSAWGVGRERSDVRFSQFLFLCGTLWGLREAVEGALVAEALFGAGQTVAVKTGKAKSRCRDLQHAMAVTSSLDPLLSQT